MPTTTFFRLPEEKRRRLEEAAWEEFSTVSFSSVSINKIIQGAHIPRGSFYQYFTDKNELFRYLLEDNCRYFIECLARLLDGVGGDLFALPLAAFDQFAAGGSDDPGLARFLKVVKLNSGMEMHGMMGVNAICIPEPISSRMKGAEGIGQWVNEAFFLLLAALAYAVMELLKAPEAIEVQRAILAKRVEIVKRGCYAAVDAGGVTLEGGNG